jgi:hypothetical protein
VFLLLDTVAICSQVLIRWRIQQSTDSHRVVTLLMILDGFEEHGVKIQWKVILCSLLVHLDTE